MYILQTQQHITIVINLYNFISIKVNDKRKVCICRIFIFLFLFTISGLLIVTLDSIYYQYKAKVLLCSQILLCAIIVKYDTFLYVIGSTLLYSYYFVQLFF